MLRVKSDSGDLKIPMSKKSYTKTYTMYNPAKIPSRPMRNSISTLTDPKRTIKVLKYWKPGFNDWLIAYYFRKYFTHIKSHYFRWIVGQKSISIVYSLGSNCSKLWSYQAKESSDNKHMPSTGWVAIITWSFHFEKLNQRPNYNSVQPNGYASFVASHTYVSGYTRDFVEHMIYKNFYCQGKRNSIITLITSTYLSTIYFIFIDISKGFQSFPNFPWSKLSG